MQELDLTGSYYDIGSYYGSLLLKNNYKLPSLPSKRIEIGLKSKVYIEDRFPEILEEIRGIADGAKVDYNELCSFLFSHAQVAPKCSIFAVTDAEQTFIGRNYDMFYFLSDFTESYFTKPRNSYKSVGQSDIFVGREDGINEHGFAVAMSGITAHFEPGFPFWITIRYLLDKCRSVQEGIKFLEEIKHHCTINILLTDSKGNMAVVEIAPNRQRIRKPSNGYISSTNHFNDRDMQKIEMFEPSDSKIRYNYILDALKDRNGQLNEKIIMRILSGHNGLVCSHLEEMQLGTLWSVVYNVSTNQIWRADGHPCSNVFKEDKRLIN
ncbi:MAG: C45 family autoproteolytic acyltransferase/hydrolase [Candidatus Hodarchaeales archaeon]|jgi:predicted choloylglycine hydrolase